MKATTLRVTAAPAEWRVVDTRGIVAVLVTPGDIAGWIANSETGAGWVATPRIGESRWFAPHEFDRAQAWLETYLPDGEDSDRFAITEAGLEMLGFHKAFPEARPVCPGVFVV